MEGFTLLEERDDFSTKQLERVLKKFGAFDRAPPGEENDRPDR